MPPLDGDEAEVKEGKEFKILTSNKRLTRLPVLLAEIKTGNNTKKLKNEVRQIYPLYQHNKRVHIGDNKIMITIGPKTFYFDLPKDVDKNLKYEIDFTFYIDFR